MTTGIHREAPFARALWVLVAAAGCNQILGNEEKVVGGRPAGDGEGAAAAGSDGGGTSGGGSGSGASGSDHGGSTAECTPGTRQCEGNVPRACNAGGQWTSTDECAFACVDGFCNGVCAPGDKGCLGAVPRSCDATGHWKEGPPCTFTCLAGACKGNCSPGETACDEDELNECGGDYTWHSQGVCPFLCDDGACKGDCKPGDKRCSGGVPESCNAEGEWKAGAGCPFVCDAGVCKGVCAPGAKQCGGGAPQTCNAAGQWETEPACSGVTPVCKGAGVCSCPGVAGPDMVAVGAHCIDESEVTNAQYGDFLDAKGNDLAGQPPSCSWNDSYFPDYWPPPAARAHHPVVYVDWCDAAAYCAWAGKRLCGGIGGGAVPGGQIDDAAKSQWFAACTSGGSHTYGYGSTFNATKCNGVDHPSTTTVEVMSLAGCHGPAAPFSAVYDLSGNVWEWEDACDPPGGAGYCRQRGGGFGSGMIGAFDGACQGGRQYVPQVRQSDVGFRCCGP
jgi:hypothetical protein